MPRVTRLITYQDRYDVADRAKVGLDEEEIATYLDMPVERLKRIFRRQLEVQEIEAKYQVLSKLYEAATSGENMSATSFWAKARCGWRDAGLPPTPPKQYQVLITTNPELGHAWNSAHTRNPYEA